MRTACVALILAAAVSAGAGSKDALSTRLDAESLRLQHLVEAVSQTSLPSELAGAVEADRKLIERTRTGAPLVRLYRMRDAFIAAELLSFVDRNSGGAKDLTQLEKLAAAAAARKEAAEPRHLPALYRALWQNAAGRASRLIAASVPYGRVSSPFSGLYYLAEGQANRAFGEFVASLPPEPQENSPAASAVARALSELEASTLAVFEKDPAGRSSIGPSALLKEAREQANAGRLEGSALLLLELQLALTRRASPPPVALAKKDPPPDTIARLWRALAAEETGDTARQIAEVVVPRYASLFSEPRVAKKGPALVTVTLVRWPYT